jgi:hypothetical protein
MTMVLDRYTYRVGWSEEDRDLEILESVPPLGLELALLKFGI